ncbi:MAG: c-type cytochrome [Acidobacteria bacterium]|nr:c-type cytochrome [Acidobacteriota bacterium]MBI3486885.1 c-type cytochrome [Acidobacteriota bacterium]
MRLALAIGTFFILVIHGVVFYNQFFHQWERNQHAYFDQARSLAKTDAERATLANRRPRIEQIVVSNFGETRVDRCTTCHIAADDPRFTTYAEPLKSHPYSAAMGDVQKNGKWERRHKFSEFGCTVCHDGQGRGLEPEYAHGADEYWPDPLLGYTTQAHWRKDFAPKLKGREYMQANCAQCHTDIAFPGTALVTKGRELFFGSNCYGCHRIEGLSDGTIGPDLSDVGKKWKLDYLWGRIADPKSILATSIMPRFNLKDEEIKALVVFLKSRKGRNFAETEIQRFKVKLTGGAELVQATIKPVQINAAEILKQGEKLVLDRACTACHKLGDRDGGIAPDLSQEGLIKDAAWIYDHFKNPKATMPDSIMPAFRFTDDEFKAMTAYLVTLKGAPVTASGEGIYKALCLRCHGEKGDGHGPIAEHLDPYPRDLTKDGFMNSKPEARLVSSVRNGVAGTSMPAWGKLLSEEQAKAVLGYIQTTFTKEPRRELKPRAVPEKNPVAMGKDSVARGEELFVNRCAGCHGKKGDGKGPNSLDILPKPRNLRNSFFVNSVDDKRLFESILYGVQGTAMPPWIDQVSNNDVGDLVNFIRSINQKEKGGQHAAPVQ